jgi:hypothetical protein
MVERLNAIVIACSATTDVRQASNKVVHRLEGRLIINGAADELVGALVMPGLRCNGICTCTCACGALRGSPWGIHCDKIDTSFSFPHVHAQMLHDAKQQESELPSIPRWTSNVPSKGDHGVHYRG